jgi:hypothetical protein
MVNLNELDDQPSPTDFRRANGAPLVRSLDGTKWERYARPSGFGHDLDDESALTIWKLHRAIEGVATTPSLAASIAAHIGQKEGSAERLEKAIQIGRGEEAADLGTALHAMAHRLETEESFRAPEPHASDLAAYLLALDGAGLRSSHCEVHLCSDTWRAAGTADRIYQAQRSLVLPDGSTLEPGQSIIGDLKTGKKLDYNLPGFAIQLAIYADGCFYDVATDERSPLPDQLHTGWGLLVHLPAGRAKCTLWWTDLQVGRVGADLVGRVRAWRKRDDFSAPFIYPPSDEEAVLNAPMNSEMYELEYPAPAEAAGPDDTSGWLEAMLPWAQSRINFIGNHPEPRSLLLRRWPASIPPLRAGAVTAMQLAQVLDLLDTIESAFNLPFAEGDPRVEWNRGLHTSQVIRSNEPRNNEP